MGNPKDSLEIVLQKIDKIIAAHNEFPDAEKEKIKNYKTNIQLIWNEYHDKSRAYEIAVTGYKSMLA